jgi:hypothetical protein
MIHKEISKKKKAETSNSITLVLSTLLEQNADHYKLLN